MTGWSAVVTRSQAGLDAALPGELGHSEDMVGAGTATVCRTRIVDEYI